MHNFIDYSDTESPVKTIPTQAQWITVIPGRSQVYQFTLQSHIFNDNNSLLHLIESGTETEFLNLQSHINYERTNIPQTLLRINVYLGDRVFIHSRNSYDFMMLLGDAGGIYGSMMLIGTVLHLFISANE